MSNHESAIKASAAIDWTYVTKASETGIEIVKVTVEEADKLLAKVDISHVVTLDINNHLSQIFAAAAAAQRAQQRHGS